MKFNRVLNEVPEKKLLQKNELLSNAAKFLYGEDIPLTPTLCLRSNLRSIYWVKTRYMTYHTQLWSFYNFPNFGRWDYGSRPFGISISKPFEIYNKNVVFYRRRRRLETKYADPQKVLESIRRRMWCIASCFVFPLLITELKIEKESNNSLKLTNNFGDNFHLLFDTSTGRLLEVSTERFGGSKHFKERSKFTIRVMKTDNVGQVSLPSQLKGFWDKRIATRMKIKTVTIGKFLRPIMFASL